MEERQGKSHQAGATKACRTSCSARHASWGRTDNAGRVSRRQASRTFLSVLTLLALRLSKMEQMKVRPCPFVATLVCWLLTISLFCLFQWKREHPPPKAAPPKPAATPTPPKPAAPPGSGGGDEEMPEG